MMSWWLGTSTRKDTKHRESDINGCMSVLKVNWGKGAKNCCYGLNQCLVKSNFETDWKHTDKKPKQ